jgi:trehalose 6-phosphate synthase/phosphatase
MSIPSREVKTVLRQLSADQTNTVMLIGGRDQAHLDLHWSPFKGVLVAENGSTHREYGQPWQSLFSIDNSWMDHVRSAMKSLTFQYNGSYLESRKHSLVWHFVASADSSLAQDLPQIVAAIRSLPNANEFDLFQSRHRVELNPPGVDGGSFLARWIGGKKFDLVIAIGGDRMNQSLFRILTPDAVTVSVNPAMTSSAKYWLRSQPEVLPFLRGLQLAG